MSADAKDWNQLLNQARVKLPGSSEAGIAGELFDTLHEFFDISSEWTEDLPVQIVIPDPQTYALTPSGGSIIRLAGVLDANLRPQPAILSDTLDGVTFANPYNVAQLMTATVVKNVLATEDSDALPDIPKHILPRWHNTILDGLLGRMMGQMAKTYSNPTLSTYHLRRFRDGTAQARVAKLRRNSFGTQAWRFPSGFSTHSQRGAVSSIGSDTNFKFD